MVYAEPKPGPFPVCTDVMKEVREGLGTSLELRLNIRYMSGEGPRITARRTVRISESYRFKIMR